jgi:hypothetical protein
MGLTKAETSWETRNPRPVTSSAVSGFKKINKKAVMSVRLDFSSASISSDSIHRAAFEKARFTVPRGDDPAYPFPCRAL